MTYQLKNIRILVVDDNQPIRLLLRSILLDLGVGMVDVASDPHQGWSLFGQFKQDLLLVDWPVIESEAVLNMIMKIRRDSESPNPHVPILLMTGFSNEERVRQARDAGITEFLMKPFTIKNLVRYMTHIVENPRPFVDAPIFTGPDRRRRIEQDTISQERRVHTPDYIDSTQGFES
jgi:two-component system chemotaxis response regulator CheY